MWAADKWKDYELIDCEGGERLERWGKYILIRPDPQIIWKGERKNPLWKKADGVYRRVGGGGSWVVNKMPEEWCIGYGSVSGECTFRLRPMGFKHTGLFPEQAANWDWTGGLIRKAVGLPDGFAGRFDFQEVKPPWQKRMKIRTAVCTC